MEYRKRNFANLRIGQQLGNYRLLRLLGQGSFADVYLGEHIHLNTQAAIKVLDMRLTNDDMGDFLTEARTIARLRHPHIVQVLEFGVEGNAPFLVMEYAPNGSLRQYYAVGTSLSPETMLPHIKQIAAALQYAHDEKLIHRDIKPENMLLGQNNEVLLSDFGIAVVAHSSRTQSMRGVAGTVAYMAPEQLRGRPVLASDQYSLGVVVYEWLSGNCPFQGSFMELATQQTLTLPPLLHEKVPTISPLIEQVVMRALAKEPQKRFASVQEFAMAFEQACLSVQAVGVTLEDNQSFVSNATSPLPSLAPVQEVDMLPLQETTIATYRGHTATVNAVAWQPMLRGWDAINRVPTTNEVQLYHSRIASASDDGTVQVWNPLTGRKPMTYRGHSGGVSTIAWSPDGKRIASAGVDSTVQVWEAATRRSVCTYRSHSEEITAVAWSPDGTRIASASMDGTVQLWDATSAQRVLVYRDHAQAVLAVAWSPNGQYIASSGEDMLVQVWLASTGSMFCTYRGHSNAVLAVAWSPDGQYLASAGVDQTAHVWEPGPSHGLSQQGPIFIYRGHQFTVSALAWSPDGTRLASASFDRTVHVWDTTTGEHAVSYTGHSNWVHAVAWAPGGQHLASASGDKTVQVWLAV